MALENLAIAQHRDTLRYARIRNGAYRPQLRRFKVDHYVYLQREAPTTLLVPNLPLLFGFYYKGQLGRWPTRSCPSTIVACRLCSCVCRHKPTLQLTFAFLLLAELRGHDPQLEGQMCACACLSLFVWICH